MELNPAALECKAILVLGCLAVGQLEEARAILRENHDLKTAPGQTFCEAILNDLQRLRGRGLSPPDFGTLEKLLTSDTGKASD